MNESRQDRLRGAIERARGDARPDVSALVDAVPALMAEARLRRESEPAERPSAVAARAWWAVPRLAVVTVVAVALASIALFVESDATTTRGTTFESVILGPAAGSDSSTGDVLLDAVLASEAEHGDG